MRRLLAVLPSCAAARYVFNGAVKILQCVRDYAHAMQESSSFAELPHNGAVTFSEPG